MSVGVHSVEIPHEHVKPLRDMVIVRIPLPPEKVGSIHVPNMAREMMQHNVMYGLVVACGPIAFGYKDAEGFKAGSEVAGPGDWVLFRPFAGTLMQGGQVNVNFGFRYISSFNDVIGVIPKEHMPTADAFTWTENKAAPDFAYRDAREPAPGFDFDTKREA
jgi:co-chaperonin GroES (HSP10)